VFGSRAARNWTSKGGVRQMGSNRTRHWHRKFFLTVAVALLAISAPAAARVNLNTLQASRPTSPTGTAPPVSYPATASTPPSPTYADGEAIVRFDSGTSAARRARVNRIAGARVVRRLLLPDTYLVRFDPNANPRKVAKTFEAQSGVKYAEPNFIRTYDTANFPNDALYSQLWA